jgi:hypothetical protein
LDTTKLAAATTLPKVKYHESSFDLQKIVEDIDLSELVNREEVIKKFDL